MPGEVLGTIGAGMIGAVSNVFANAANIRNQNKINKQMLDFSKNAYSYAAADKMRAGLSPLDTGAAETPALSQQEQSPVSDGSFLKNAADIALQRSLNDSVINANNAKAAADTADAENTATDTKFRIENMQTALDKARADLQNARDKHSEYAKTIELRVKELEAGIENMRKRNEELQTLIDSNSWNNSLFKGLGLPTNTSVHLNPGNAFSTGVMFGMLFGSSPKGKEVPTPSGTSRNDFKQWHNLVREDYMNALKSGDKDEIAFWEQQMQLGYKEWKSKVENAR